jgi:hypothetical protein
MGYVSKQQIEQARRMDLLTWLQRHQPDELIATGRDSFRLRSHDSLSISNGKWFWWSRGIGGHSALDYLVEVQNMPFTTAVELLCGQPIQHKIVQQSPAAKAQPPFVLPGRHTDNRRVVAYLARRGIDFEIINHCIKHGLLYEDKDHHNAVFVGYEQGKARYAYLRSTCSGSTFMREVQGSDKRCGFRLAVAENTEVSGVNILYVFESAIDLLSKATLIKLAGEKWREGAYLSLGGIAPAKGQGAYALPPALSHYLRQNPAPDKLVLCLDDDPAGRLAAQAIIAALPELSVCYQPPSLGKDYNEMLQQRKNLAGQVAMRGQKQFSQERGG